MRKATLIPLLFLSFTVFSSILTPLYVNANPNNDDTLLPSEIQIDRVDRVMEIRYGGLVVINDTIQISANESESVLLKNFLLGFPHKYESNLCYCLAYNSSNQDKIFRVTLDSGLQGKIGYYGINIVFPKQGTKVNQNKLLSLTVITVFSNLMSSVIESKPTEEVPEEGGEIAWENVTVYTVDFPKYPSLCQSASKFVCTVILPDRTRWENTTLVEDFYPSYVGDAAVGNYTKSPLDEFVCSSGSVSFTMAKGSEGSFGLINVYKLERKLKIDGGVLSVSDFYHLSNKAMQAAEDLSSVVLRLPLEAYNITAFDQFGNPFPSRKQPTTLWNKTFVTLDSPLKGNESTKFKITYRLTWEKHINQQGWDQFNLSFTLFDKMDWLIEKFTGTLVLPEGAKITTVQFSPKKTYRVQKDVFQEKISFTCYDVTSFETLQVDLAYTHSVFWASFRPTLWIGALVAIGCAVALAWRAPKPSVPVLMKPVRPRALKDFVEAYEERAGILSKLKSLREKAGKGKVSRRRYKVQRKMLEQRVSTLSKDLSKLREKIRAAGVVYADLMSQLEVAEAKLETVRHDIERTRARYQQGKLSREAYRRLLEEYETRRGETETTVDGILIRLREETR